MRVKSQIVCAASAIACVMALGLPAAGMPPNTTRTAQTTHSPVEQSSDEPSAGKQRLDKQLAEKPPSGAQLTEKQREQAEARAGKLAGSLRLSDQAKAERARRIMADHYGRMEAWHVEHDPQLKELWTRWQAARSGPSKDENKARFVMDQIDATYASFKPQHYAFVNALAEELTLDQVESVKDQMTSSPGMKRTYNAYLQIIPELTDQQKSWILGQLRLAREDAMDTTTGKEAADLFKKYKIRIEAYIDDQGYDWRKRYTEFHAKKK